MNTIKKLYCLTLLAMTTAIIADGNVAPFIAFRSAGRDTARKVVGMSDKHVHLYDMGAMYGTLWMAPAYERSFKSARIAKGLFGTDVNDDNQLRIQGNAAKTAGSDANAWIADNFVLPSNFSSVIEFSPRVQNCIIDLHAHFALDNWCEGLYLKLYGPIVNARYDLNAKETVIAPGSVNQTPGAEDVGAAGFLSTGNVDRNQVYADALEYFRGDRELNLDGVNVQKLLHAKFKKDKDKETCFGELRAELGYNIFLEEDYHFGLNIQGAAPTGHRPNGEYLFEAQCGNNKHWELGGGAHMHYTLYRCPESGNHLDFYSEIDITHLFDARQKRTFDLKNNGPHSRYLLASKLTGETENFFFDNDAASAQFDGEVAPVANISTIDVDVSVGVQLDWVAMLNYTYCNWSMDLGYNLWYRSSEDISLRSSCKNTFEENTWIIKGNGKAFAFQAESTNAVGISDSFSNATIHNFNAPDQPVGAALFAAGGEALVSALNTKAGDELDVASTISPVFIKLEDLDLKNAETRGISHKIFGHINYTWMDCENWIPYVGIGGALEFGNIGNEVNCSSDASCPKTNTLSCSLSKWSVLLKAGVSFDSLI